MIHNFGRGERGGEGRGGEEEKGGGDLCRKRARKAEKEDPRACHLHLNLARVFVLCFGKTQFVYSHSASLHIHRCSIVVSDSVKWVTWEGTTSHVEEGQDFPYQIELDVEHFENKCEITNNLEIPHIS